MTAHKGTLRRRAKRVLVPVVAVGTMSAGVLAVAATPVEAATINYGYSCPIWANVSLFGGPSGSQGCGTQSSSYASANSASPSATLTAAGVVSNVDSDGLMVTYGPANIVSSPYDSNDNTTNTGALTAQTVWNGTGNMTALSQAKALGPSPFWTKTPTSWQTAADVGHAKATCSSSSTSNNGSVEIKNGVVDTAVDPESGMPTAQTAVPNNPSQGYTVNFTVDTVSDEEWGYIVFNERSTDANGVLTINAAHMYLMGPIAVGDVIYGQVKCGRAA